MARPLAQAANDGFTSALNAVRSRFTVVSANAHVSQELLAGKAASTLRRANVMALGDLYGQPRKLFDTLIAGGHVRITPEKAKAFSTALEDLERLLSQKTDSAREQAKCHLKTLQGIIKQDMTWADPSRRLILVGDTIGDKAAMADRPIVSLCNQFRQQIDVVASNHDYDVLRLLAGDQFAVKPVLASKGPDKTSLAQSLALTPKSQHPKWAKRYAAYLLHQKLIQLQRLPQGGYTLFTHAPVSADHMRDLARFLRAGGYWHGRYRDLCPQTLPEFVQAANTLYQDYTRHRLASVLPEALGVEKTKAALFESPLAKDVMAKCQTIRPASGKETFAEAFSRFLTNHGQTGFLTLRQSNTAAGQAPLAHGGVSTHVFGHVRAPLSNPATPSHPLTRICLDNGSGLKPKAAIALWHQSPVSFH